MLRILRTPKPRRGNPPDQCTKHHRDQPQRLPLRWLIILGFSSAVGIAVGVAAHNLVAGVTVGILTATLLNAIVD